MLLLGKHKIVKGLDFYWLTYFFVFIFSAVRFDVGYDYTMYYHLIEGDIKFLDDQLNRIAFLSRKLVILSHDIGFTQFFFIVSSFLIIFLFYKTIRKYSLDFSLSTFIFICFPVFFFQSLSVIRQYMAIAIVFYGYRYIKERKILPYFALVFLATMFHKSAFLALPIYFIYGNFFVNKKIILFLYILGFFSSNLLGFLVGQLSETYAIYINGRITGEGGNLILIFFQTMGFFLLPIIYSIKDRNDKEYNFYLLCFYIGLLIWTSLSKYGQAGLRGGLYFISFTILLIPHLKMKVKQYYFIRQSVFVICLAFFFLNLYIGSKHKIKDPNMPYQTFFNKKVNDLKPNE